MSTLVFTCGLLVLPRFDSDSKANLTSKARLGYSQLHDEDEALEGVSFFVTSEKLWRELQTDRMRAQSLPFWISATQKSASKTSRIGWILKGNGWKWCP